MNYTVISWCPGDKCDPCKPSPPVLVDAFLRASCTVQYPPAPGFAVGDPFTSAQDPNLVYYNGQSLTVTITHTVQGESVAVSGSTGPMYGYTQAAVIALFPDAPVRLDPTGSSVVTSAVSLPGWNIFCIPFVVYT